MFDKITLKGVVKMNKLKTLRKEKGLSQQALGKAIGVSYRTVQNWENGVNQIKSDKAELLADFFGVGAGYLLGYTDNSKVYDDEKFFPESMGIPIPISEKRDFDDSVADFKTRFFEFLRFNLILISDKEFDLVFSLINELRLDNPHTLKGIEYNEKANTGERSKEFLVKNGYSLAKGVDLDDPNEFHDFLNSRFVFSGKNSDHTD